MNQVAELKGDEGGRCRIWAQRNTYLVDLDAMTIMRIPEANSFPSINDRERRLRSLDRCRVGVIGLWTMASVADRGAWRCERHARLADQIPLLRVPPLMHLLSVRPTDTKILTDPEAEGGRGAAATTVAAYLRVGYRVGLRDLARNARMAGRPDRLDLLVLLSTSAIRRRGLAANLMA